MTDFQTVQKCISNSNWPTLIKVMFVVAYWMMKKITSEECAELCLQIDYTFDASAKTLTNGSTTYTMLSALEAACDTIFPNKVALGPYIMRTIIKAAKNENYITAEDYTGLVAKL